MLAKPKRCDGYVPSQPAHPVSFLPLVSFGSLLPVESPVALGRGRRRRWGMEGSSPRTIPKVPAWFSLPYLGSHESLLPGDPRHS